MEKNECGLVIKKIEKKVDKSEVYINEKKAKSIISDISEQLDIIEISLNSISDIISKSIELGVASKSKSEAFKELKKKVKFQANATSKLNQLLSKDYNEDLRNYPLKLLNDRIAEIEKRLAELSK